MSALNSTLSDLARAIVQGEEPSREITTGCANYSVAVAIEVYRNNYRGNLHDALTGAYPVILQLVGPDFFRLLARKYIGQHPSVNGNLHSYGERMAEFVASFEPAQGLVYLADVAALEWACHRAYFAEDAEPFDIDTLAQVPPELHGELMLRIHPSCHIISSCYPVAAIWQAHQKDSDCEFHIDLASGSCNALVSRKNNIIFVDELSDADALWLQNIMTGDSLGSATNAVLGKCPDFDLQTLLHILLQQGLLVDG